MLYHEDHNGLETVPDILDKNTRGNRTLVSATSPITLFVRGKDGKLSVAAIQLDYKPGMFLRFIFYNTLVEASR